MNIFQKIAALFGAQYALLIMFDGDSLVRRVYTLGRDMYAHPHSPSTRAQILPKGKTESHAYVIGWKPVTPGLFDYFEGEL